MFNSCFGSLCVVVPRYHLHTSLVLGLCTAPKLKVLSWVICMQIEATGLVSSLYYNAGMPG